MATYGMIVYLWTYNKFGKTGFFPKTGIFSKKFLEILLDP